MDARGGWARAPALVPGFRLDQRGRSAHAPPRPLVTRPLLQGQPESAQPCRTDDHKGKASTATVTALPLPLVKLPKQGVSEEREQFEQSDAGVALVEVRPLRVVDGDSANDLIEELRVDALVDL
jgi:hypothetical protein